MGTRKSSEKDIQPHKLENSQARLVSTHQKFSPYSGNSDAFQIFSLSWRPYSKSSFGKPLLQGPETTYYFPKQGVYFFLTNLVYSKRIFLKDFEIMAKTMR